MPCEENRLIWRQVLIRSSVKGDARNAEISFPLFIFFNRKCHSGIPFWLQIFFMLYKEQLFKLKSFIPYDCVHEFCLLRRDLHFYFLCFGVWVWGRVKKVRSWCLPSMRFWWMIFCLVHSFPYDTPYRGKDVVILRYIAENHYIVYRSSNTVFLFY